MPTTTPSCPRCGKPRRAVPGGPQKPVRVVHEDTGREDCGPAHAPTAPAG